MHKFNRVKFNEKQAARKKLKEPHTAPKSIKQLSSRVYNLEKIIGVKSSII